MAGSGARADNGNMTTAREIAEQYTAQEIAAAIDALETKQYYGGNMGGDAGRARLAERLAEYREARRLVAAR